MSLPALRNPQTWNKTFPLGHTFLQHGLVVITLRAVLAIYIVWKPVIKKFLGLLV